MLQDKEKSSIKLTQFAHGAGCGCKIAPGVLKQILSGKQHIPNGDLLVGNAENDDASAWNLGDGRALISTTDFFMPIVDDPNDFGAIAAANAISDVYAMGGKPFMALAILGWPVEKLSPDLASEVIKGASEICKEAGVIIAGGHTIDSPEPIFGLSVNGFCAVNHIKRNHTVSAGDWLYLTKPLGTGIITTAAKRGILGQEEHLLEAIASMKTLNKVGQDLGSVEEVSAMTDVTGFGLAGHLIEMLQDSGCSAEIEKEKLPVLQGIEPYLTAFVYPDMTMRNYNSVQANCSELDGRSLLLLCDPQTSGGLLIAAKPEGKNVVEELLRLHGLPHLPIGRLIPFDGKAIFVK